MALHGQERPPRGLLSGAVPAGRERRGVAPETDYEGEPNVSKKEQAEYAKFMDNGFKLIYDENNLPQLLQRLGQGGESGWVAGLATVTVGIVRRLVDSAEQAGEKIDDGVLLQGSSELMGDIANLAKTAGVHEYTDEEIENAFYTAMDQYGTQEIERGNVDQETVAADFQAMTKADQEGRLEEVLPGVEKLAQQGGPNSRGARRV